VNSLGGSLPSLLAATVAIAIGMGVVLRDRSRDEFVLFGAFCVNLGLFHLARFFFQFSGVALFSWGAQTISLVLPYTANRCFGSFVPNVAPARGRLATAVLVVVLAAHASAFFVLLGRSPAGEGFVSEEPWTWISMGLSAYVILGLFFAASRFWRAAKAAEGTATAPRMLYLFYASIIALAFGSPLIPFIGPIVTATYLYFVAQTLLRERLLDLPELLSRILILAVLVILVSAMYALLLLWIPQDTESRTTFFLFNIGVASYAVIVLIDPLRAELESRIETLLMRDRNILRRLLVQLRFRLLNVIDEREAIEIVLNSLSEANRVTRASVYTQDAQGRLLLPRATLGEGEPPRLDVARQRPFLDRLASQGPQLRDVVQRERSRLPLEQAGEIDGVLETLGLVGASLAVPIFVPDRDERPDDASALMGAIFVDDERLLEPFSREEVELFEGLAAQLAITLKNTAAYEKRKERERLAALGEMSAGLAHEIRNPLGAIKGAVQVIEPSVKTSDPTTAEFLGVIVEEVERLNRVVTQFLRYSRPFAGDKEPFSIVAVINATLRVIAPERIERVSVQPFEGELPPLVGDAEALRQVFLNLVKNALDATDERDPPGKVWIDYELRPRGLPGGRAVAITVHDDGPGFSAKTMTNLFVPFHTTKAGGTGLGLPISQRIVENHNGVIEVSSSDAGARFSVVLPVAETPS
jgi:signal transduction histidine kinase